MAAAVKAEAHPGKALLKSVSESAYRTRYTNSPALCVSQPGDRLLTGENAARCCLGSPTVDPRGTHDTRLGTWRCCCSEPARRTECRTAGAVARRAPRPGASGQIRSNASALVDGRMLVDCGPEAPRQAQRAGLDLAGVRTVLISHAHDDHLDPSFLMHRGWVSAEPLRVIGPAPAIARCAEWLAPDQNVVALEVVTAGDLITVDQYRVQVLPATHEALGEAVLYAIEGPDGRRLLYATDTGPWKPRLLELLAGWRFDLVLLEETFGGAPPAAGPPPHLLYLCCRDRRPAHARRGGRRHPRDRLPPRSQQSSAGRVDRTTERDRCRGAPGPDAAEGLSGRPPAVGQ